MTVLFVLGKRTSGSAFSSLKHGGLWLGSCPSLSALKVIARPVRQPVLTGQLPADK